jgi:predicted amidohydrolase YtcJ
VTDSPPLMIRNVEVGGRTGQDVRVVGGRIAEIGPGLPGVDVELDGAGGALIPGLIDHHIHLLGTAAQVDSVQLDNVRDEVDLAGRLTTALEGWARGAWVRATGYHEAVAGTLTREQLDHISPTHPIRVQHRSGALWMLNSAALDLVVEADLPDCVERDAAGRLTGRIWRGDAWLRARIGDTPPPLAPIGAQLAACGVTGVADASVTTGVGTATLIAAARASGDLPQRVMLMSGGALDPPRDDGVRVGPVKILLDEHDLPDIDDLVARIIQARSWGRRVAVHCVTAVELALTLAAFETAGAQAGDRIEHGGVIPEPAITAIVALGLTVVTQPGFIFDRGDRYLAEVEPSDHADLYRCASLLAAGVPVAASSDAPYSNLDPWVGLRAAMSRRTRGGQRVAVDERVGAEAALALYLGDFDRPGGPARRVAAGAAADLCLLAVPLAEALTAPDAGLVAATFVAGRMVFDATSHPRIRAA